MKIDLEPIYRSLLESISEDITREGLRDTPARAARALRYLTRGYQQKAVQVVNGAIFHSDCDEMVIVKNIELYSLCEHHLLPFIGKCHVGLYPPGQGNRSVESSPHCRCLRPSLANPGESDPPDCQCFNGSDPTRRRRSDYRSAASMYDDARRRKAKFLDENIMHARIISCGWSHPRRVFEFDSLGSRQEITYP